MDKLYHKIFILKYKFILKNNYICNLYQILKQKIFISGTKFSDQVR